MGSSSTTEKKSFEKGDEIQVLYTYKRSGTQKWCKATILSVHPYSIRIRYSDRIEATIKEDEYESRIKTQDEDNDTVMQTDVKDIQEWSTNDIIQWMTKLEFDDKNNELKELSHNIQSNEITGEDLVGLESVTDFVETFEISDKLAEYVYGLLRGKKSGKKSVKSGHNAHYEIQNQLCITGLCNLGNTCYLNSVIQLIMQTPRLVEHLRKSSTNNESLITIKTRNGYGYWNSSKQIQASMLNAFINLAQSYVNTDPNCSVAPHSIAYHLRHNDPKFSEGTQCDALAALTKILTVMDQQMIDRAKSQCKEEFGIQEHSGYWQYQNKILDSKTETKRVDENLLLYNLYGSIIRDLMCFVERNIFQCMQCNYTLSYYEIKDKVLLPIRNDVLEIDLSIYVPSKGEKIDKTFRVLDYGKIDTLQCQVYQLLLDQKKCSKSELKSIKQIRIGVINPNTNKSSDKWIVYCDNKKECKIFRNKSVSVFALVEIVKSEFDSDGNNECKYDTPFVLQQLNIFIDKNNKIMPNKIRLSFIKMKSGHHKGQNILCAKSVAPKDGFNTHCYLNDRIVTKHGMFTVDCASNSVLITLWIAKSASENKRIKKCDFNQICDQYKKYILRFGPNYGKIVNELQQFKTSYGENRKISFYQNGDHELDDEMKKLDDAITIYQAMKDNAQFVKKTMGSVYKVFSAQNRRNNSGPLTINNITDAFDLYLGTKFLSGKQLKCKCKNSVVRKESAIVKYPEILLFSIERYNNGQRLNKNISYPSELSYENKAIKYELYGVSNHDSTSLKFGHYTSYVKALANDQWYGANDESIYECSEYTATRPSEEAIILVYKQTK